MRLRIIAGSFDARLQGISFRIGTGTEALACGISRNALFDLAGHHSLNGSDEALFQALSPVIGRLIAAKFAAGRLDEGGGILISSADLLIYGFEATTPARVARDDAALERAGRY